MTISYVTDNKINYSNIKVKEENLNLQYNSDFVSNSQINLNIKEYSLYIYENKILLWYIPEKKGIIIEVEDLVFHAISSSDNNTKREGNFPYLYIQIIINENSIKNLNEISCSKFENFKNATDSIEIYIISSEYRKLENLYDEITNLLNNFDNNTKNNVNNTDNEKEDNFKFNNKFDDVLLQLTSEHSLNPKEWYFEDVPFENIKLTTEGQAISDRLEKMLDNDNYNFESFDIDNIERKELESEVGQFDNADED
ncbi:hypothetical protein BCR32DRAFT_271259 [Anaeromyces robustus]|uniref:Uncharacterized protein n=1 Tax=Anaeromyces robustus TaxID=1754192 RepID=A0A1Y1WSF8_9FUNG|nr:hypothetical protein BCR32DRAFT_271259 [Anaeromyces robustus]|eukprot:ORX76469.1 hypothetical protein BCR32DRAFT_271259 [Anaeromyces robustus]